MLVWDAGGRRTCASAPAPRAHAMSTGMVETADRVT